MQLSTTEISDVRPLGAFERLFYRYSDTHPLHFVVAAEFPCQLSELDVRRALDHVQRRHPLLTVRVVDDPLRGPMFFRDTGIAPLALQVHDDENPNAWQLAAADELSRPFDRSTAPLARATLLSGSRHSVILLTFDHTVADGISAMLVLNDVVSSLNGAALAPLPVPPSQEVMLARYHLTEAAAEQEPSPERDPQMDRTSVIRPFDGATPHVVSVSLTEKLTAQLIDTCRTQRSTVHAALVVAASYARRQLSGQRVVRVLSPINFRSLIGDPRGCADYFMAARTATDTDDGMPFWDQARLVNQQLRQLRSRSGIATASAAVQQGIAVQASTAVAEQFLLAGLSHELTVTNLGVRPLGVGYRLTPSAVWGPVLLNQIAGETVTGVVTYRDQLRLTTSSYSPPADFLEAVVETVRQH